MPAHVRKGDLVMVIAGHLASRFRNDPQRRTGRVLRVIPDKQQVIVQGLNVKTKNVPKSQDNPQGGTVEKEMPIHWSNVQPVVDGKPTRVRFETRDDGSKVRTAVRNGEVIGEPIRKAR